MILSRTKQVHDPLNGYIPQGYSIEEAKTLRQKILKNMLKSTIYGTACRVNASISTKWCYCIYYSNNIRQVAFNNGVSNAFDFPGFVPAYIRPLFCEGKGPF